MKYESNSGGGWRKKDSFPSEPRAGEAIGVEKKTEATDRSVH